MLFHLSAETTIPPAEGYLEKFFLKVRKGEANLVDLLRNKKNSHICIESMGKER